MTTTEATAPSTTEEEAYEPFTMDGVGKHTLVYGAGILMSKALSFLMLPVYTRYLTPSDYGIVGLIEITLDVVAIMGGGQLVGGIFRFYHKADGERRRREVVTTALLALGISYIVLGLAVILAAPLISRLIFDAATHANLIRLAGASLAFQSFLLVPLAYARVKDRSVFYVGVSAGKLVLAATLNVVFVVVMRMGPAGVFTSSAITSAVVGIGLTIWLTRGIGIRPSKEAARDLLRFGIPLVFTQFATFIATFSDRYFLQHSAGTADVGIYNLAYQFGFLLAVVGFLPFNQVWMPKRFEIASRSNAGELLARGFIYANVLLMTCAVGIVLFVKPVLTIMSAPSFHGAASLVPVILIAYVFQSWAKTQDIGILVEERTEYLTAANWIAAIVAVLGYWLLVPPLHGWGAAIATAVSFGVRYLLTYVFSQRLWRVDYRWGPVVRHCLLTVAISAVALVLPETSMGVDLLIRFALLGVYCVAFWYAGILTDAELAKLSRAAGRMWHALRVRVRLAT